MPDDSVLRRLAVQAFEAADPAAWTALVADIRCAFRAGPTVLRSPGGDTSLWLDAGACAETRGDYLARWHALDPWACSPDGHRSSRPGRCFIGREIVPLPDILATEFHADFGRQHGLTEVLSVLVDDVDAQGQGARAILALFRPDGTDEYAERDRAALSALQPALRAALRNYHRLGLLRDRPDSAATVADALPQAAFFVRAHGLIEHANRPALALVGPLVGVRDGRIVRVGDCSGADLACRLKAAARADLHAISVSYRERGALRTASVQFSRLTPEVAAEFGWPQAALMLTVQPDDNERIAATRIRSLGDHFGLTATELSVLAELCRGQAVEQIAASRGLKTTTLRTHVRHLLEKTQTRRLMDLVRLARG